MRSVQRYLEITNPQTEADLSVVEDIDSGEVQRAFLQVVLEFFYLQGQEGLSDAQEEFLNMFSVSEKQSAIVEARVRKLFKLAGPQGLVEKYGYVAEETSVDPEKDLVIPKFSSSHFIQSEYIELSEELVNRIFDRNVIKCKIRECVETEHYCLVFPDNNFRCYEHSLILVNKITGEMTRLDKTNGLDGYWFLDHDRRILKCENKADTIVIPFKTANSPYQTVLLDLSNLQMHVLENAYSFPLCTKSHYVVIERHKDFARDSTIIIYDVEAGTRKEIPLPRGTKGYYPVAEIFDGLLYLIAGNPSSCYDESRESIVNVIDLNKNYTSIAQWPIQTTGGPKNIKMCNGNLYGNFTIDGRDGTHLVEINLESKKATEVFLEFDSNQRVAKHLFIDMYDDCIIVGITPVPFQLTSYRTPKSGGIGVFSPITGKTAILVPDSVEWEVCGDIRTVAVRLGNYIYFTDSENGNAYNANLADVK